MRLTITPGEMPAKPPCMPPHWLGVLPEAWAPAQRAAPLAAASAIAGAGECEAALMSSKKAATAYGRGEAGDHWVRCDLHTRMMV